MVNLTVAGWVEQHPIVRGVTAAMRSPDLVMAVPSCNRGDRFAAVWTAPILAFPEVQQGPASFQGGRHLETLTLLQVVLPLGIVGVDLTVDLGMPYDGQAMSCTQMDRLGLSLQASHLAGKHPMALIDGMKVACLHPPDALIGVSSLRPSPQRLKDGVVYRLEHFRADHMAVIHRPPPHERMYVADEVPR